MSLGDALLESGSEDLTDETGNVTAGEMAEAVADAMAEAMARTPAAAIVEEPSPLETNRVDEDPGVPEVSGADGFAAFLGTARVDGPFSRCRIDSGHDLTPCNAAALSEESQSAAVSEGALANDRSAGFQPLLRVERFVWPEECLRMSQQAADQLSLLTDSLTLQQERGREVVGFGGHGTGQGCTTILLSVARRLEEESGLKAIIVDGDFGNPCLSERLGIACRTGWDDVLAAGEPLEEAAIVSERDGLGLLPLGKGASGENGGPPDLGAVTRILREHYDLVLVDLGELNAERLTGAGRCRPIQECVDGVVVVRDVRSRMQSDRDETSRLLCEAGLVEMGVAENFVACGR